ncbi:MAG: DUF5686 family protein [Bacteroidota bacterium]
MLIFLLSAFPTLLRGQTTGTVIDEETRSPIAFANIVFENKKEGTVSDLQGRFVLPVKTKGPITISCVGYHTQTYPLSDIENKGEITLKPKTIELEAVEIYPDKDPARQIMQNVIDNIPENNPDEATDYTCIIYHKMTFDFLVPDSVSPADSVAQKIRDFSDSKHVMLIESVSEKKHMAPDKNQERIISGRVSGFQDPALSIFPALLQPFTFYDQYIELMDNRYLNPVSDRGFKHYDFFLRDTISDAQGQLFYISFQPKEKSNIPPLKGTLHITPEDYAIKNLKANTAQTNTPFELHINQQYQIIDGKQWFPSEQESRLVIRSAGSGEDLPFPLEGKAKSLVTAVDISPELTRSDFSGIELEDDISPDSTILDQFRYQPLTAKDSITYSKIDSLGLANNFDQFIRFPKILMNGQFPVGPLRLDFKHIAGYNNFEGLKLGMGLWTGEEWTGNFSLGGYFKHAFKIDDNHYGGGIKWDHPSGSPAFSATYSHDLHTTGKVSFLNNQSLTIESLLKSLAVSTKDKMTRTHITGSTRLMKGLSTELFFTHADVDPVRIYDFDTEATEPAESFTNMEYGVRLRWAYKEKLSKTFFGTIPEPTNGPILWLNYTSGRQKPADETFTYSTSEARIQKSFNTGPSAKTSFQLTGGLISGEPAPSKLYSFLGTYDPFGLEVPGMFATMAPNEFAADRFVSAFFTHKIPLRQNQSGSFKPEIVLLSKAGWGDLSTTPAEHLKTFNQGFYESGIKFDNLMNALIFKYGVAIHHRYGPYQKEKSRENWSFRLSLDLTF